MEHSAQLLKKLLVEVVQRRSEFSTITVDDVMSSTISESENNFPQVRGYEYTFKPTGSKDGFDFRVTEDAMKFELTIVPEYSFEVPVYCTALGLSDTIDLLDFVSSDNDTSDSVRNWAAECSLWVLCIEKTPELMAEDMDRVGRSEALTAINIWRRGHTEIDNYKLFEWYIDGYVLAPFEDQTRKHQIHQMMSSGLPRVTMDEIIEFMISLTEPEHGYAIEDIIRSVEDPQFVLDNGNDEEDDDEYDNEEEDNE